MIENVAQALIDKYCFDTFGIIKIVFCGGCFFSRPYRTIVNAKSSIICSNEFVLLHLKMGYTFTLRMKIEKCKRFLVLPTIGLIIDVTISTLNLSCRVKRPQIKMAVCLYLCLGD